MSVFTAATRRGFLKILGAAPLAVPAAAKSVAPSLLSKVEPIVAAGMLAVPSQESPGEKILGKFMAAQVRDLKAQFDAEEGWAYNTKTDGIDYDIACLKSTSRSYKIIKQIERNRERWSLGRRIEKVLWP